MWYFWLFLGTVLGWTMCAICSANKIYGNNELADTWNDGFKNGHADGYSTASRYYEEKIRSMADEQD